MLKPGLRPDLELNLDTRELCTDRLLSAIPRPHARQDLLVMIWYVSVATALSQGTPTGHTFLGVRSVLEELS